VPACEAEEMQVGGAAAADSGAPIRSSAPTALTSAWHQPQNRADDHRKHKGQHKPKLAHSQSRTLAGAELPSLGRQQGAVGNARRSHRGLRGLRSPIASLLEQIQLTINDRNRERRQADTREAGKLPTDIAVTCR
jgi:hypothetical protein